MCIYYLKYSNIIPRMLNTLYIYIYKLYTYICSSSALKELTTGANWPVLTSVQLLLQWSTGVTGACWMTQSGVL